MHDTQESEGLEFWCRTCKAPLFMSWQEIDRLRTEQRTARVLCRCKRWIGNIGVRAHIVDDCKR